MNLKAKMYVSISLLYFPNRTNKIIKTFMIEDFLQLPLASTTPVANLELLSPRIFEKISKGPNRLLRGLGETDS